MAVKAKAETTIVDMTDAYSVILSSETYTFIGGTAGAQSGLSCATDVTAFCGTNLCSKVQIGTITCPTGITATVSNNNTTTPTITFKTTATISAACEATIPVVVDGITVNKKFSFAVAKTGATGATGAKGDKGDTGATGKGIKSTSITYQAGTSQTTAPTGTWSTSIPATSTSTPYLWTKTVITYDDNTTSTSYSVSSTLDSLEIGGRNLLRNSNFNNGTKYWVTNNANYKVVTDDTYGSALSFYTADTGNHMYRIYYATDYFKHIAGITYALSFYAKASEATTIQSNVGGMYNPKNYSLTTEWQKFTHVYTASGSGSLTFWPNTANVTIYLANIKLEKGTKATDWTPAPEDLASSDDLDSLTTRVVSAESNITQLSNKITAEVSERTALGTKVSTLEQTASGVTVRLNTTDANVSTAQSTANTAKTNAATAQSTADSAKTAAVNAQSTANTANSTANTARTEAANAAKTATNYLNFSSDGLVIGDMTASKLGKNVLIDTESVNIRDGDTVLATFSEDLIELGKNSASSVISLCGGKGTIKSTPLVSGSTLYGLEISSDVILKLNSDSVQIYGNDGGSYQGYVNIRGSADVATSEVYMMANASDTIRTLIDVYCDDNGGFIKESVTDGTNTNESYMYPTHTAFQKRIELSNNQALRGVTTGGKTLSMVHMSTNDNTVFGYGGYTNGVGKSILAGNMLAFMVKTAKTTYKPYYEADLESGVSDTWMVDGIISASALRVYFTIPLDKPIIGNPTVTVSSMNGLIVRQNGSYVYGTSSTTYAQPSKYTASIVGGNCIHVIAYFDDKTNALNNYTCHVKASISIEFS